jgi:hypothetical protein
MTDHQNQQQGAKISVECHSELRSEKGDDYLQAHEIRRWLESVPDGATISQIIRDMGSQRDPMPVLVGLRAKWSETR